MQLLPRLLTLRYWSQARANFSLRAVPEESESMYRLRFEKDGAFMLLTNDINDIRVSANWNDLEIIQPIPGLPIHSRTY